MTEYTKSQQLLKELASKSLYAEFTGDKLEQERIDASIPVHLRDDYTRIILSQYDKILLAA